MHRRVASGDEECIDLAIKILQICDTLITRFN